MTAQAPFWLQPLITLLAVVAGGGITTYSNWLIFSRQKSETQATELRAIERESAQRALEVVEQIAQYPRRPAWLPDDLPPIEDARQMQEEWMSKRRELIAALVVASIDLPGEFHSRVREAARAIDAADDMWSMFHISDLREYRVRATLSQHIINCLRAARRRELLPELPENIKEIFGWVEELLARQEENCRKIQDNYQKLIAKKEAASKIISSPEAPPLVENHDK